MGKTSRWAGAALLTLLLAGLAACGGGSVDIDGRTLQIHDDAVVIHARRGPGARIRRNGGLLVGDKVVALTSAQRVLSRRYYAEVEDIRRQGIVMGEAGAVMATGVVGSLFSALFHDDAHIINNTADAQSGRIQADAPPVGRACGGAAGICAVRHHSPARRRALPGCGTQQRRYAAARRARLICRTARRRCGSASCRRGRTARRGCAGPPLSRCPAF